MKRMTIVVIVAALFVVTACTTTVSSSSPTSTPANQTAAPLGSSDGSDVTRYFAIEEIGLGPDGYVTLINYTEAAASLDAGFLCQAEGCVDLPDAVVGPGDVARVAVGDGTGLEKVVMTGADLALTPADGEVGLYHSKDVTDESQIRAYLQWGSTPHELTPVAIKAGLWTETGYAPSAPHATRLWKTEANLWVWDPGK